MYYGDILSLIRLGVHVGTVAVTTRRFRRLQQCIYALCTVGEVSVAKDWEEEWQWSSRSVEEDVRTIILPAFMDEICLHTGQSWISMLRLRPQRGHAQTTMTLTSVWLLWREERSHRWVWSTAYCICADNTIKCSHSNGVYFFQVGTLDPVSDYRSLIGRKDVDNFDNGNEYIHVQYLCWLL